MKSTKNEKHSTFPKLQIAPNGNIFLMHTDTKGTCVYSYCGDFLGRGFQLLDSNNFTDFNGSITLENEHV